MEIYGIARKEWFTHGHGNGDWEIQIRPIDSYLGNFNYHPFFQDRQAAEDYLNTIEKRHWGRYEIQIFNLI
jgi:hypothetical protein